MLLAITPNVCLERTLEIPDFAAGQTHRVASQQLCVIAGGKGVNAARVASRLGIETLCSGWIGRNQAQWFAAQMARENLAADWVEVHSDTRITLNILDARADDSISQTEIIEEGSAISLDDGTRLLQKVDEHASRAQMMLIGGSYPPAVDTDQNVFDAHAMLIGRIARRHDVPLIYDGRGRAFEIALRDGRTPNGRAPWAIKPNLDEAKLILKRPIDGEIDERRAIGQFLNYGVEVVLLSCGARGLWLGTRERIVFLNAPRVREISAVGSGDSLVGAFAARFLQTPQLNPFDRLLEAARWGVAAGAVNATQKLSAHCTRDEIEALLNQVTIARQITSLNVN